MHDVKCEIFNLSGLEVELGMSKHDPIYGPTFRRALFFQVKMVNMSSGIVVSLYLHVCMAWKLSL